jgi:hypothetical protein
MARAQVAGFRRFRVETEFMSTKTTIAIALAAGFLGGIVSQRLAPAPVFAQVQPPVQKEVRAENFVVVDANGTPRGAFGVEKGKAWPQIEITDGRGHLEWARWGGPFLLKGNSSLVPQQ